MGTAALEPGGIDALAPTRCGVYADGVVEVRRQHGPTPERRRRGMVRTPSFDVEHVGAQVHLVHRVPPAEVDDDLAGRLADELFGPGWLRGSDLFERLFVGVVLSCADDPLDAWEAFYRQTLARVGAALAAPGAPSAVSGHGGIADYAPVYACAERLVGEVGAGTSVLELGCCFGFLSLRLSAAGHAVLATDLNAGSVELLRRVAPRLARTLDTLTCDAAAVSLPDACVDTVVLVHLLEHVDAATGDRILAEAARLARRRVVVGVPLEDVPDPTWGHVRAVSLADLEAWGRAWGQGSGVRWEVREHHGGWLVLDVG